ncbi:DNA (cytosine-5-)-methyltransferase [cyanobiont of Ornithocercus magnificus]|nr:DNA (cytosine-5-)-methyltransferase [cyanobiont of Ornithocercus magnificus]
MYTCIDLFAGCGGLSTGLELAGFQVLFANEIHQSYSTSLKANHPGTLVDVDDIRLTSPCLIYNSLGIKRGELDLVAGGTALSGI